MSSVGVFAVSFVKGPWVQTYHCYNSIIFKVDKLKEAGANYVILDDHLKIDIKTVAPQGVDVWIELVGPQSIPFALENLARKGTACITGVLDKGWTIPDF